MIVCALGILMVTGSSAFVLGHGHGKGKEKHGDDEDQSDHFYNDA